MIAQCGGPTGLARPAAVRVGAGAKPPGWGECADLRWLGVDVCCLALASSRPSFCRTGIAFKQCSDDNIQRLKMIYDRLSFLKRVIL